MSLLRRQRGADEHALSGDWRINTPARQEESRLHRDSGKQSEAWVKLAKLGDLHAFSQLCEANYTRLLRSALQITRNLEDAEDTVQWTLMTGFTHIHSFDERSSFSTWITRIAINCALGILRKRKAKREVPIEPDWSEEDGKAIVPISDMKWCPMGIYENHEKEERLLKAVSVLTSPLRDVLSLYHEEELSMKDIAVRLNISVSAVKARLLRARRRMRDLSV